MSPRPPTFDHLLSKKKAVTKTVTLCLDPELGDEHEDARRARDVAASRAAARPDDSELAAQLWEAEAKLAAVEARLVEEEVLVDFVLKAIGRAAYSALVDDHPPTAEQRAKAKRLGLGEIAWNEETFPPALVAACLVEPAFTADQVAVLWKDEAFNAAELNELLSAAIAVNSTRRTVEVGKGSKATLSSGRS